MSKVGNKYVYTPPVQPIMFAPPAPYITHYDNQYDTPADAEWLKSVGLNQLGQGSMISHKFKKSVRKTRKSKKRSIRKSVKKSLKKKCQQWVSNKIAINMREYKAGKYKSPKQAIAVAYSQVLKKHPECKRVLKRKNKSK